MPRDTGRTFNPRKIVKPTLELRIAQRHIIIQTYTITDTHSQTHNDTDTMTHHTDTHTTTQRQPYNLTQTYHEGGDTQTHTQRHI